MKKFLLLILAVSVIGGVYAQKRSYAIKDMRKAVYKNPHAIDDKIDFPLIPFKPVNHVSSKKAFTSTPIGTSGNIYMCLVDMVKWLTYNPELNMITFVHRLGGPWGGTSGNLRVKYSNDFFATKDSLQYIQPAPGLCRYPSNILYNPTGNTDPLNAVSVVCGPSTAGSGWVNNYFGSQNIGGANFDLQLMPMASDTTKFLTNGFSGGSGKYHAAAGVSSTVAADASKTPYYSMYNGTFNSGTNKFDWTENFIHTLFKLRTFSNAVATWSAFETLLYEDNGLNGFFYAIGKDSLDNPGSVAMPIVWKTTDGGETFTKEIYQYFATIPALQAYIWPTLKSLNDFPNDSTQWVFRPNISAGSSVDEGNSPGTIDKFGNLHIAAIVEGLYSSDPDSLEYSYSNQPKFLFDLIRTENNGWNAVFIDTINTNIVNADSSGFGVTPDNQGWSHWIRMSKNADGSKVFATWTETDLTISQSNIMPEIQGWGYDVANCKMTVSKSFANGDYNKFYMMAADKVAQVGSLYKIPVTYVDIYESNPFAAISPQKHYYLDGIEYEETEFNLDVPQCIPVNVKALAMNTESVSQTYPNPANGNTKFNVTINETSTINVVVTNVLGQIVYQTNKNNAGAGSHTFNLDTKNWNYGVYFYTVATGKNKITKKMIVE